jgi:hypothetical protein
METVNSAEEFVYRVCRKSFLSMWSYANPQGKRPGKELCDILVLFGDHVVIFSVKRIEPTNSGDSSVDWNRWRKRAIEASAKQIYGAERWIRSATHIVKKDGSKGLPLPLGEHLKIHRVAVALGSEGKFPISFGDFGKGFVHVFDEASFNVILRALDTSEDFISYLTAKEELHASGTRIAFEGQEEDLLAIYLHRGCQFPKGDRLLIGGDLWNSLSEKPEFIAKQRAAQVSYVWDRLIETLSQDILNDNLEFGESLEDSELAVRTMASENRFNRRLLGKSLAEFLHLARQRRVCSRCVTSPSKATYVFLAVPFGVDRKLRVAELAGRCFVARSLYPDSTTVIGIATEQPGSGEGFSIDLYYLFKPTWTAEDQKQAEFAKQEFGFFAQPQQMRTHEEEYPKY